MEEPVVQADNVQANPEQKTQDNLAVYQLIEKSRFMIHAKEADLDKIVPLYKTDFPILTPMDYGKIYNFSSAEQGQSASILKNTPESKMVDSEKWAQIYDLYKGIIEKINAGLETSDNDRFVEGSYTLALSNRLIIADSHILNQYPAPISMDEAQDFSGAAYYLFVAANAQHDYLVQAERYIREYTASPNHSLDQKLNVLSKLSKENIVSSAVAYRQKQMEEWQKQSYSTKDINEKGKAFFLSNPEHDKVWKEYKKFLDQINQQIVHDEYDSLPSRISKAQYHGLSNIDQAKYMPEQHDNYRSKAYYTKRPIAEVISMSMDGKKKK